VRACVRAQGVSWCGILARGQRRSPPVSNVCADLQRADDQQAGEVHDVFRSAVRWRRGNDARVEILEGARAKRVSGQRIVAKPRTAAAAASSGEACQLTLTSQPSQISVFTWGLRERCSRVARHFHTTRFAPCS